MNIRDEVIVKQQERISELEKELSGANEFIRDIAKLFGEDDLGLDGKQWSIDDFKDALQSQLEAEALRGKELANTLFEITCLTESDLIKARELATEALKNYNS